MRPEFESWLLYMIIKIFYLFLLTINSNPSLNPNQTHFLILNQLSLTNSHAFFIHPTAYVAMFALPKVYETNKQNIDQYLDLVRSKIVEITDK